MLPYLPIYISLKIINRRYIHLSSRHVILNDTNKE